MRFLLFTFVFALIAAVQSFAVRTYHVVHEKRAAVSSKKWAKREKLSPTIILPMRIGLSQRNLENGYEFLMDVSDPASKNFGKHWTSEEVIEMFAPEQATVDAVKQWLIGFGIGPERFTHSDNKGWIGFDATVEEADRLLAAEYHVFEHVSGHQTHGCDSYHVPKHIQKHVDYITPGVKPLAPFNKKRSFGVNSEHGNVPPLKTIPEDFPATAAGPLAICDQFITPDCIRALYKIPETPEYPSGLPRANNSLGVFEEADYYSQNDLDLFFANFTPSIPQGTHPIPAFIDGAFAPLPFEGLGPESDLDFELAYPLIYPQTITLYQTDDFYYATNPYSNVTGGFNTFLDALDGSYCTYSAYGETGNDPIDPNYPDENDPNGYKGPLQCGVYKPTNVISISYGGQEYDLPEYYQRRQCNEFMKLGLQGHSILFASGDSGVAGPNFDDNSNGCLGPNGTIFSPTWPDNCPYVTTVGATKILPNHTVHDPESAVTDPVGHPYKVAFSSGGGFSNIYRAPDYQKAALDQYFEKYSPPYPHYRGISANGSFGQNGGIYNRAGRGIPDVAALGDNIATMINGSFHRSGGTSASTPIFASIINRINEQRLNAGKKNIGFLNPALYSHPEILNDITNGSNPGCNTPGFSAVPGWDPVTGLGTPNYPKMLDYFMGLP